MYDSMLPLRAYKQKAVSQVNSHLLTLITQRRFWGKRVDCWVSWPMTTAATKTSPKRWYTYYILHNPSHTWLLRCFSVEQHEAVLLACCCTLSTQTLFQNTAFKPSANLRCNGASLLAWWPCWLLLIWLCAPSTDLKTARTHSHCDKDG